MLPVELPDRPKLRPDLELLAGRPEEPEGVLVYDPARRDLFELAAEDLPLLGLLDGTRSPRQIAREAGRPLYEVEDLLDDLSDLMLLEDPEQDDLLDAWRRQQERQDRLLQPVLDSRPGEGLAGRPIHVVDDARHTCLCCGACCLYAVPISLEESQRLGEVDWPEEIVPPEAGPLFQVRPGLQWGRLEGTIATRSDPTRCAFLDESDQCRVHQQLGPQAKPFACRLFPLAYPVATTDAVIFSLTFECPWVHRTYDTGERLAAREAELRALVAEMEEVYALPASVPLDAESEVRLEDYLAWERGLLEAPEAPASEPTLFLDRLRQRWAQLSPLEPGPVPDPGELGALAATLQRAAQENRDVVVDSPEGEEGAAWAVHVLGQLAARPEQAWAALPWADGPAADRFLNRFVRHFVEGKQHLLYQPLWMGLRALAALLLLARGDAGQMGEAEARPEGIPAAMLNRALSRWCRLFDLRPLRLALLSSVGA